MSQFVKRIQEMSVELNDQDAILDSAPDEFIDEMTGELMYDPVMLPSSKTILNRSTIEKCLMDRPCDPYDRTSLTIEQVIPRK